MFKQLPEKHPAEVILKLPVELPLQKGFEIVQFAKLLHSVQFVMRFLVQVLVEFPEHSFVPKEH